MAHFHVKKKKGRPYLYVREIARVDGKPKVISQIYLGSPEKVAAMAAGHSRDIKKLKVEEFGALWLANQMDIKFNLAQIVNEIVPPAANEKGPSVGEYFLYCVLNRMVKAVSKNKLSDWYKKTAVQQIRPVNIKELTSQRYWEKWDRVDENALDKIARRFFEKLWETELPDADCLLFDTTNYYTFMASHTESDLARRGKNKAGRHYLRQIGLGLLVARKSMLPIYYSVYPGNVHDSRLFEQLMDDMFGIICGLHKTKERLTVVIDKGMNAEGNYAWIDEHARIHFVTTYSTYFAKDLTTIPIDHFKPAETAKNRRLVEEEKLEERLLSFRTTGEYWGKKRAVVVTYNPATARKKNYTLDGKLETLRQELLAMRTKVQNLEPHWRKADTIKGRYHRLCEDLHVPTDLYIIEFKEKHDKLTMSFRKNVYRVDRKRESFGKNIIITDNLDWTTTKIIEASLDRWQVENQFRISKDDLVGTQPIRHWTDSKIRCHLLTCVVAMTYLRIFEIKLRKSVLKLTAAEAMSEMRHLHSVLEIADGRHKPRRRLENPTKTQAEVLSALGYCIDKGGVLQQLKA